MAYNQEMLRLVNTQFKRRAYKLYLYDSDDTISDVSTPGYFEKNEGVLFREGDIIQAQLSDGYAVFQVDQDTASATNIIGGSSTIQNAAAFWDYITAVGTINPNIGAFLFNNITLSNVTVISISSTTSGGADASLLINSLKTGDLLLLQAENNANVFARFTLSGEPSDNGGWFQVPVTFSQGLGFPTANNTKTIVRASYQA